MVAIYFPSIHPSIHPTAAPTPVLSCSPKLAPQFCISYTPPRRQVPSTLVSKLCLACLHGQANFPTFFFFLFLSLLSLLSLSLSPSLFSIAPEPFPSDPV